MSLNPSEYVNKENNKLKNIKTIMEEEENEDNKNQTGSEDQTGQFNKLNLNESQQQQQQQQPQYSQQVFNKQLDENQGNTIHGAGKEQQQQHEQQLGGGMDKEKERVSGGGNVGGTGKEESEKMGMGMGMGVSGGVSDTSSTSSGLDIKPGIGCCSISPCGCSDVCWKSYDLCEKLSLILSEFVNCSNTFRLLRDCAELSQVCGNFCVRNSTSCLYVCGATEFLMKETLNQICCIENELKKEKGGKFHLNDEKWNKIQNEVKNEQKNSIFQVIQQFKQNAQQAIQAVNQCHKNYQKEKPQQFHKQ